LPDLRGRVPIHQGPGFVMGQLAGTENVTLTQAQMPSHSHAPRASTAGDAASPIGNFWSADAGGNVASYSKVPPAPNGTMNAGAIGAAGSDVPHQNMQPYLAISYIISLFGVFPTQN
jgi:microcystin-dependent protein